MLSVGVIIPTFNSEDYIKECLDSVLNQTLRVNQVVIIDDCSTDSTIDIVRKMTSNYKRFSVHINKKNNGLAKLDISYNTALEYIKTDLLCILEGDDFWDTHYVEKVAKYYAATPELHALSLSGYKYFQGHLEEFKSSDHDIESKDFIIKALTDSSLLDIPACGISYNLKILKGLKFFKLTNINWVDRLTFLNVCAKGLVFLRTEKLVYWRRHEGSYTFSHTRDASTLESMLQNLDQLDPILQSIIEANLTLLKFVVLYTRFRRTKRLKSFISLIVGFLRSPKVAFSFLLTKLSNVF